MQTGRPIVFLLLRDTVLALLVAGLVFLNFGHVTAGTATELRLQPDSWCGAPLLPGQPDHPPCHACRIGAGAALPPPPAAVASVVFAALPVFHAAPAVRPFRPQPCRPLLPRGPPLPV